MIDNLFYLCCGPFKYLLMKNATYFILLILFTSVSCSDNDNDQDEPIVCPIVNPYKTGKDLSTSKWEKWTNVGDSESYSMLGYGYDATGKYAHPAWVRAKIFDVDKYKAKNDGGVSMFKTSSSSGEINFSGTKEESIKRLAALGGFSETESTTYKNLFRATFDGIFSGDTSFPNIDYYYVGGSSNFTAYLGRFIYNQKTVSQYLTDEFKFDVETLSADKVIEKYGTHLLREVYLGRRIDYVYRANSSDMNILLSWANYNEYYYFKIPNSGVIISTPEVSNPDKENLYIQVVDDINPNPNTWMFDITNYQAEPITFNGWNNVTNENVTLINFSDKALIPIYEIIEDSTKKEEIRQAYEKYLKE